jgi:hypothetical protein|nr:hypothetical protein [Prevotella sp.]
MKKQTYISPAVTICHCATATILAGSEPIKVEIVEGEYEGDFQSKPHDVDLWADDDEEEKNSNLYWQI